MTTAEDEPPRASIPVDRASGRLPVAPSMGPVLESMRLPVEQSPIDRRVLVIGALAIALGLIASVIARLLTALIGLITNLSFYGRWSTDFVGPAGNHLGWLVVFVPVIGGLIVGVMARYGSAAIRGHGIPEAMEQVLFNESRIPARITLLKPLSAAISIGTGGPFGAEGPIIATGGALGSLRRTGAARLGGGAQDAARGRRRRRHVGDVRPRRSAPCCWPSSSSCSSTAPRSLVPVALACAAACGAHMALVGSEPAFAMPIVERRAARRSPCTSASALSSASSRCS